MRQARKLSTVEDLQRHSQAMLQLYNIMDVSQCTRRERKRKSERSEYQSWAGSHLCMTLGQWWGQCRLVRALSNRRVQVTVN